MAPLVLRTAPDVLVLGGGGIAGEAWMAGLLAALADETGVDWGDVEHVVGTSAGAIVAARLLAGAPLCASDTATTRAGAPDGGAGAPADAGGSTAPPEHRGPGAALLAAAARAGTVAARPLGPLVPLATWATTPGGAAARALALAQLPRPLRRLTRLHASIERLDGRFDGRLRIVTVDRRRGRRVVFGAPGAPAASVADAVVASCAVPWVFAPVTIGDREYVDGGVWSPTNLDVAPARRATEVLCISPTGHRHGPLHTTAGALRALSASATALEATILRRRGARVTIIVPDAGAAAAMGDGLVDPGARAGAHAGGLAQGRGLARSPAA